MVKRRITAREKRFALARMSGLNQNEAAEVADPKLAPASVGTVGTRLSRRERVQQYMEDHMTDHNLTIERVLSKLDVALDAKKPLLLRDKDGTANLEDVEDWATQMKALTEVLRLMGAYEPMPKQPPPPENPPDIPTTASMQREIRAAVKRGDIKTVERIVFNDPEKTG